MDPLRAVIGVDMQWGENVLYVFRSPNMQNYPLVWGLPSERLGPAELLNPHDLNEAQTIFNRMAATRFVKTDIPVLDYLYMTASDDNPRHQLVVLYVYEIEAYITDINNEFYWSYRRFSQEEFDLIQSPENSGLCTRSLKKYRGWFPKKFR